MAGQAKRKGRAAATPRREATINIRVGVDTRDLIDRAAAAAGKSRSEFMIDVSRQHAVDVLLDRRLLLLPESAYHAFLAALEEPPPPTEALKGLLRRRPAWER